MNKVNEVRAYAKIVGPGWEYYMTKPKIVLGRGGRGTECDVIISTESAVSRQHFTIRFAPERQAFEVENLSKNGILVNGEFIHRLNPPILLRSQADIAFGRYDPMRISFLLPVGSKSSIKKKGVAPDRHVPLLQRIGEAIVEHDLLTASGIRAAIERSHPYQLSKLGSDHIINSSIRQILMQNEHVFVVVDSIQLKNIRSSNGSNNMPNGGAVKEAYFTVRPDQKSRFYRYNEIEEGKSNPSNGFVANKSAHAPRLN